MHAFLITGGDAHTRQTALDRLLASHGVEKHNCVTLTRTDEEMSIGIRAVRTWEQQVALAPLGKGGTAGIILDAELLTQEAQQAILKTIEEPPGQALIILTSPTPLALLPTILSRCVTLQQLPPRQSARGESHFKQLDSLAGIGRVLKASDEFASDREAARQFVEESIMDAHKELIRGNLRATSYLESALLARTQLAANVNPKMVIDTLLLSFHTRHG